MARPKLSEGATLRLNMMITDEEIRAIETWRFRNRVPSKSEAVRALCRIALSMDPEEYECRLAGFQRPAAKPLMIIDA